MRALIARMLMRLLLPNVLQPRTSVLLNAAFSGSVFVLAIKRAAWHCELSHRCTVWFSEEFLHEQPHMASIFVARMAAMPHPWTVVTDRGTFCKESGENNKRAKTMYQGFVPKPIA